MQIEMETPEQKNRRVTREKIAIAPYDPRWPELFRQEKEHVLSCLPRDLIVRIEHFGSTAVPGLAAKPIVDMLLEVTDPEATPVLEAHGYEYFWRPTHADDGHRSTRGSSSGTRTPASARITSTWSRGSSPITGIESCFGTT